MENNSLLVPASNAPFTEGAAVRASIVSNAGPSSPQPLLGLPQRRLGGLAAECDWMPVQLLGNASNVCLLRVTSATCASGGPLSADAYVTAGSQYFSVLAGTGNLLSSSVSAAVTYYCVNSSVPTQSNERFFAPSTSQQSDLVRNATTCYDLVYLAPADNANTTTTTSTCYMPDMDASFQSYQTGSVCTGGAAVPVATLSGGSVCEKAVVAVNYTLYWSGAQLTGIIAQLLLANINVSASWDSRVTQRVSYTWSYLPAAQQSQLNGSSAALTPSQLGVTSRASLVGESRCDVLSFSLHLVLV